MKRQNTAEVHNQPPWKRTKFRQQKNSGYSSDQEKDLSLYPYRHDEFIDLKDFCAGSDELCLEYHRGGYYTSNGSWNLGLAFRWQNMTSNEMKQTFFRVSFGLLKKESKSGFVIKKTIIPISMQQLGSIEWRNGCSHPHEMTYFVCGAPDHDPLSGVQEGYLSPTEKFTSLILSLPRQNLRPMCTQDRMGVNLKNYSMHYRHCDKYSKLFIRLKMISMVDFDSRSWILRWFYLQQVLFQKVPKELIDLISRVLVGVKPSFQFTHNTT